MNTKIKGMTHLYAVIGDPISHSISPELHNRIFEKLNMDKVYMPLKIRPQDLQGAISLLRDNFKGFNVTIPHKQEIMKYLDTVDKRAQAYGAVNTVKIEDGKLKGYNTDGLGFMKSLERENSVLKDKRVLLLGAGGAARVIAYELVNQGAYVTVVNRERKRAHQLKTELVESTGSQRIELWGIEEIQAEYDCIINATPVGMHPLRDAMPINEKLLEGVGLVYDLIYNPAKTKLLKTAEMKGIKTINGLPMLFYQAIKAQEIWLGETIPEEITLQVFGEMKGYLLKNQENSLEEKS